MSTIINNANLSQRMLLNAAKLPIFYFIVGFALMLCSYGDNFFPFLVPFGQYLDAAYKIGNIFIAVAFVTFFYKCIAFTVTRIAASMADKHAVASLILKSVRKGLRLIYLLISLNVIINMAGPSKLYLVFANNLLNTIIIGSVGWVFIQIFYTLEAILYHNMMTVASTENMRVKLLYNKMHILRSIGTVVIVVITVAAILMTFSSVRNIGISLLASAGFLTAIIGLAAQKTLGSLFYGLQLAISQPIKMGDIVAIDGVSGLVEEITFTNVTLKLDDRRRIIPINFFIEKAFENLSQDPKGLRGSFSIFVDYLLPIASLRDEFNRLLKASDHWDKLLSKLEVIDISERAVEVRFKISASSPEHLGELKLELREKLLEFIRNSYPEYFPKVRVHDNKDDTSSDEQGATASVTAYS